MAWLRFQMDLSDTPEDSLILGELAIMEGDKADKTFTVTSGIPPYQHKRSEHLIKKGPIPSCDSVDLNGYFVNTQPLDRRETVGIEGNFYWVDIPPKVTINRVERSEFGIHFDANVPGSAGCIVFQNQADWKFFQGFMASYFKFLWLISLTMTF